MDESIKKQLCKRAEDALKNAYAPYSGFLVGAALLTASGTIYTGVNIESASFSPTNCAERTAVFKAVSEGERNFTAIAIVGGRQGRITDFCPPCGVCRQVLREFCRDDFPIFLTNGHEIREYTLSQLLPLGFSL